MAHPGYWEGGSQFWAPPLQPTVSSGNPAFAHAQSRKRRAPRAAQACDSCRIRKTACNEERPCLNCSKDGIPCKYSSRKSLPRHLTDIDSALHQLHKFAGDLDTQIKRFGEFKARFDELAARLKAAETHAPVIGDDAVNSRIDELDALVKAAEPHAPATTDLGVKLRLDMLEDRIEAAENGVPKTTESGSLHRSGSHHLISLWPTVSTLLRATLASVIDSGYVMRAEEAPASRAEALRHHDDMPAARQIRVHDFPPSPLLSRDVSRPTSLLQSYVENMYSLHPIIDIEPLCSKNLFNSAYEDVGFAPPRKRRKLDSDDVAGNSTSADSNDLVGSNALDLALANMILALGEICLFKRSSANGERTPSSSDSTANTSFDLPSFTVGSDNTSVSPRSSQALPSPFYFSRPRKRNRECAVPGMDYYETAARTWAPYADGSELRHAQFAVLASLYKAQLGQPRESMNWICLAGRTVQALLHRHDLLETSTDIGDSYTASQARLRQKLKFAEHDLIVVNAWTVLQLEGDILSELQLPNSGITQYQDRLPYPRRLPGVEFACGLMDWQFTNCNLITPHNLLVLYTHQMWLRKRLNLITSQLYSQDLSKVTRQTIVDLLDEHKMTLRSWRTSVGSEFQWSDDEGPSEGIIVARLRAKYYGAMVLAHRPFLDYVLHGLARNEEGVQPNVVDASGHERRDPAAAHLFRGISSMPKAEVLDLASCCIEAGFQSSYAFDGIPNELIVTNIHGTAHAQFGNALVLAAAYHSGKVEIEKGRILGLLRRTIAFLERQSFLPATCREDLTILREMLAPLTNAHPPQMTTTTNMAFGQQTSLQPLFPDTFSKLR